MTVLLLLWICTAVQQYAARADKSQALLIGAIIEEGKNTTEIAFREAIKHANFIIKQRNEDSLDQLDARIEYIRKGDSYHASKKACDLLKSGVIAILGPSDPLISSHVISTCRQLNIPYLQTEWDQWRRTDSHTLNVHPHYKSYAEALDAYIIEQGWDTMGLIYADEKDLMKYEPILNSYAKRIIVRQWKITEESHKYVIKFLSKTSHRKFIVDIPFWEVRDFLIMASVYNMTTEYYSYVFTDWDVQQLDLTAFKIDHGANITCMSILRPVSPSDFQQPLGYGEFLRSIYAAEPEKKRRDRDNKQGFPTQVALIYDAILLFTHGLINLSRTRRIQPSKSISCEGSPYWTFGEGLIKAVNSVQKGAVYGLTREIHLNNGVREDFNLSIMEVSKDGFKQFGFWTKPLGLQTTKLYAETQKEAITRLANSTLRVTTVEDRPFVIAKKRDENGVPYPHPDNWHGFCIEILRKIAAENGFNFTVHIARDKKYGNVDHVKEDGTEVWNGMIGELMTGDADLAVASLTITYERERAVDFTTPFMNLGLSIIYRRPEGKKQTLFSFLQPLSPVVWGYVLATYLMVSFVLYAVARFSPYEWLNPHPCNLECDIVENQFTMLNSLWFTMGSLMQQGTEMTPKATSTRIVTGIWGFFTLIIISSYTANLAAFLTVERMVSPIDGAESLSRQSKIKYGVLSAGSSYTFFEKNNMEVYKKMFEFMKANKEVAFVKSIDEGISRVSQDYAFILESTMNEYNTQRNCSLMSVGGLLDSKGYGIGFPTGSPYRDPISETILKLQKSQDIEKLRRYFWREYNNSSPCDIQEEKSKDASSLGVEQVGGVFVMLFIGIGLSLIVSIIEFIFKTKKTAAKEKKPLCTEVLSELKFAMQCMASSKRPNPSYEEDLAAIKAADETDRKETFYDVKKSNATDLLLPIPRSAGRPLPFALDIVPSSSTKVLPPSYQTALTSPSSHGTMLPGEALDGQLSPLFIMEPYAGNVNPMYGPDGRGNLDDDNIISVPAGRRVNHSENPWSVDGVGSGGGGVVGRRPGR